jgi:hypothetical protein
MPKPDVVTAQLRRLIARTIVSFGEEDATVRSIADRAIAEAEKIAKLKMQTILRRYLVTIAGEQLRHRGHAAIAETTPPLRGLEALLLPSRIVVPHLGVDPDEGSPHGVWRRLHKCSLGDVRANLQMRDQNIEAELVSRDVIQRILDTGIEAGGRDDDLIEDILGVVTA